MCHHAKIKSVTSKTSLPWHSYISLADLMITGNSPPLFTGLSDHFCFYVTCRGCEVTRGREVFTGFHCVVQDFFQSEIELRRAKCRESGDWNADMAWDVTTGAEPVCGQNSWSSMTGRHFCRPQILRPLVIVLVCITIHLILVASPSCFKQTVFYCRHFYWPALNVQCVYMHVYSVVSVLVTQWKICNASG